MRHTYYIHGMTCNGCRSHVEETLSKVKGVSKTLVDLDKAEVIIEMESNIPLETFQESLKKDGGGYSIHSIGEYHQHSKKAEEPQENGNGVFYCPMHCEGEKLMRLKGVVLSVEWI